MRHHDITTDNPIDINEITIYTVHIMKEWM